MKIARIFAGLFGFLGTMVLLCSIALCLASLDAPVKMEEVPQGALSCAQGMAEALDAGDLTQVSQYLYGQPDLGAAGEPAQAYGVLVWDAFTSRISCEFKGECYADDTGLYQDAVITVLDIPSVTASWQAGVHTSLTAKVQAAQDMTELYDENNNFRQDLVDQVVREAVEDSLQEENLTFTTHDVTLKLICREGKWWVVPDQALLSALSGGLA